jgi:hypothetical protein
MMDNDKKTYAPPQVTTLGNAVKQTRGFGGRFWEILLGKMAWGGDEDLDDLY